MMSVITYMCIYLLLVNMVDDPIKEQCVSTLSQNNDSSLITEKKPSVSKIRVVPFHSMAATNLHDSCTIEKGKLLLLLLLIICKEKKLLA